LGFTNTVFSPVPNLLTHQARVESIPRSQICLVELSSPTGTTVRILNYGATLTHWTAKARNGEEWDVLLGFDSWESYLNPHPYFGSAVGPCSNRIEGATYQWNNNTVYLSANEATNHLHGGFVGYSFQNWTVESVGSNETSAHVTLALSCKDLDGYLGESTVKLTYKLESNTLWGNWSLHTNTPLPWSPTLHPYFRLGREKDISNHQLQLLCDFVFPKSLSGVPHGQRHSVQNTPKNFLEPKFLHSVCSSGGLDDHFEKSTTQLAPLLARCITEDWCLEVCSDYTGLQVYTMNTAPNGVVGKNGEIYKEYSGLCLEPQRVPNSVNTSARAQTMALPGVENKHWISYTLQPR
jgi:aldose 1-epimerase